MMGLVSVCEEAKMDEGGFLVVDSSCSLYPARLDGRQYDCSRLVYSTTRGWQTCKGSPFGALVRHSRGAEHAQVVLAYP